MKRFRSVVVFALAVGGLAACSVSKSPMAAAPYQPDDPALYKTIAALDSTFFLAYNTCDVNLAKYADFFADTLEFYHDKGGLSASKQEVVAGTQKNVCGKVTRELVRGSIEVYPINHYGAVEMGIHKFSNNTDKSSLAARAGKFVIIWRHRNNGWKITRVISLH